MEISKCIKYSRQKNNISQESLAEQLNVSRQTISSWETGKSYPDIVSVIKMSDIFNISLDKMLKEDIKLIHNMQEKMDSVTSNQSIIFTMVFALILFGGMYFIHTYIDIPKINDLSSNIIVLIVFVVGTLIYLLSNIQVGKFLNQKTSNKTIIKTIIVILVVFGLFFIFPLLEKIITIDWQLFIARITIIAILIILSLFIFKKIDKW